MDVRRIIRGCVMTSKSVRQAFLDDTKDIEDLSDVKYLVVAVKLPTGAIEIITNTEEIASKIRYYTMMYNEDFRLHTNHDVRIVGYMLV